MKRTRIRFLTVALLAALLLAAGCGSDDEDDTPAAEYQVLGGRLVWCAETLESLTVPDSASSIGNNAFNNCPALTKVTIPATVEKIGSGTFYGVAVRDIVYLDTMRAWDALARASGIVSTLTNITVTCTDGIWRAGMYDWEITDGVLVRYCGDAADVKIPGNVTAIGAAAFEGRADITGVTIPSGVTAIGDGAFKDCAKLTDVAIPASVTTIGAGAFDGCTSLTNIDIPASVTAIGAGVFSGSGITEISYGGTGEAWDTLVTAGGIADELDGITVRCADGSWTSAHTHTWDTAYTDGGEAGHYWDCTNCDEHSTVEPHQYTYTGSDADSHTMTCTVCAATKTEEHRYGIYTDNGSGTHSKTCADCGHSETAQHTWGESYTNGGDGGHYKTCTTEGCNAHSETKAHDYEYKDNADGSHTKTCKAGCGYSEDIDHNWSDYTSTDTNYHSRICTVEGFTAHTERVEHDYEYKDNADGNHTKTCTADCGYSEDIDHNWSDYTSADADYHSRTCTVAGFKTHSETEAHDCEYKDNADGTHTTTCTKCAYSQTEAHRYKDGMCEACGCPDPTKVYMASTGSDTNAGSRAAPFATIQKAVDAVLAANDGTSAYTIYVDGMLNGTTAAYLGASGMADFSALTKNLTLTIKPISGTATLDGGARFDTDGNVTNAGIGKRVIYANPASGILNLTLENLVITGGNASDNGGGIYFISAGGSLTMTGCEVSGNKATTNGGGIYLEGSTATFTMTGGTISGNTAKYYGGGVFVWASGTFTMQNGEISGNTASNYGGGVYVWAGCTVTMSGGEISGNTATVSGGGVHNRGTFAMSGGKITGNNASGDGGGVYNDGGTLTMEGGTVSSNSPDDVYP